MIPNPISVSFKMGDGREVSIETGRMARQADGAVVVRQGNAMLLATVVAAKEPRPGQSFFPLTVDYQEKFASAGRIPGSFFKREGRLSDSEVLISRLIDRALRPLFPDDYYCDVQVLVSLISSDENVQPDALACLAASAALAVSDVPVQEIISEVRVARVDGEFVINPSREQMKSADMDFIIAATENNIMMVEGESKECQEADIVKAIEIAHEAIRQQINAQKELRDKIGGAPKREVEAVYANEELLKRINDFAAERVLKIASAALPKHERSEGLKQIRTEFEESLGEDELSEEDAALVSKYFGKVEKKVIRGMVLDTRNRLDGRQLDEVRPLTIETDVLPSPHGSALFTRGETQSLTTVTLGTSEDELLVETAATSNYHKFILHYNFPPFSTGETRPMRGPGRREVGHGNLAKRSLEQMMPNEEQFPYTTRIVSDILESNGSSSMATVCAGSLAMMDAGVPYPKHVGGVAMGMISEGDKYAILTDILGDEDHLGDMDFKVTGTRDGICGIQMDIKVDGLSMAVLSEALEQARKGRLHILDAMYNNIPEPRAELKPHAPRIEQMIIDREYIGAVIGPGGKIIQEIQRETGATINIEEVDNKGVIKIFSSNKETIDKAVQWIKGIVAEPEIGETYEGKVKSIVPFGAFIEFMPGKEGLLHISEVSWKRLETLEGVMAEGDTVKIKLIGTDPKSGKLRLSRKVLMEKPEGYVEPEKRERRDDRRGGGRDDRRGGGNRRDDRRGSGRDDRRGGNNNRRDNNRNERRPQNDNNNEQPQQEKPQQDNNDADMKL